MCPRCLQHNEICLHVLQCPAETSRTHWEVAINELEETLIDIRTNPNIIRAWKSRLLGWQDHHQFPFCQFTLRMTVYSALQEQDAINWSNFLMGRLSENGKMLKMNGLWWHLQMETLVTTVVLTCSVSYMGGQLESMATQKRYYPQWTTSLEAVWD